MRTLLFTTIMMFSLMFGMSASAQVPSIDDQTSAFVGSRGADLGEARDPREIAGLAIQVALGLLGIAFLGYLIYGGFVIMTASGDDSKVTKGREIIRTAVIGVIIIMASYAITLFVTAAVTGSSQSERELQGGISEEDGVYLNTKCEVFEDTSNFQNGSRFDEDIPVPTVCD